MLLRRELQRGKLVRPHRRSANVPNLPALDDIVECFHDFFNWHFGIHTVNLENVDVRAEASNAGVYSIKYALAGETFLQIEWS